MQLYTRQLADSTQRGPGPAGDGPSDHENIGWRVRQRLREENQSGGGQVRGGGALGEPVSEIQIKYKCEQFPVEVCSDQLNVCSN